MVSCEIMLCDAKCLCHLVNRKMMCCKLRRSYVRVLPLRTTKHYTVLPLEESLPGALVGNCFFAIFRIFPKIAIAIGVLTSNKCVLPFMKQFELRV